MAREVATAPMATTTTTTNRRTKGRTNESGKKPGILLQYIYYVIFTFNVELYSDNIIWNVDASSSSLSSSTLCCLVALAFQLISA